MTDRSRFEVVVVGGGPAGMTTALYTTRLGHRTAVFEKAGGRHAKASHVHNLYGVSEDVAGQDLARHAVEQVAEYGGAYHRDAVESVRRVDESGFVVEAAETTVEADRVVFATGFTDIGPSVPGLERFTGRGLHYCLHCDAYSLGDGPVFVLGNDDHAATVAMLLLNFTADVDLLLDGDEPTWSGETDRQLAAHPVDRIDTPVVDAYPRDDEAAEPWLGGLTFAAAESSTDQQPPRDGERIDRDYLGGFAMYGKRYNTDLAVALGCECTDAGALAVDDRYETSVQGVYAVGDVTHGQNQTVVALGDGAKAGIALHQDLRTFPRSPDDLEGLADTAVPAAPPELRARMRAVREAETHAGLREPPPDR